jgi:hypothetical protein
MAPLVKAERQGLIYLDVLTEAREPLTPEARDWAVNKLRTLLGRIARGRQGRQRGAVSILTGLLREYLDDPIRPRLDHPGALREPEEAP